MPRKPAFISHSPEREAQIQRRLLDAISSRFNRSMAAELERVSMQMLDHYDSAGFIPPLPDEHFAELRDIYLVMAETSIRTFGARIVSQGKSAGHQIETKQDGGWADFFRNLAQGFIQSEMVRRRIVSVAETTRKLIVNAVTRGERYGLGTDAIGREIRKAVPSMSKTRANLIARTETHGAANYGAHNTAKQTGLDLIKEWVSVEDARTRDFGAGDGVVDPYNHRSMNGQTKDMDDPFDMPWIGGGTIPAMFPGDPSLPPSASINCRCAVAHRVKDFDDSISPAAVAAVQGDPVNEFAYRQFVAPKSVAEMQRFVQENGIADVADLKGLKVSTVAPQLKFFQEVTERFDLDPIAAVGPATRFGMRGIKSANAAIYQARNRDTGRLGIFHMPTSFGDSKRYSDQQAAAISNRAKYEKMRQSRLTSGKGVSQTVKSIATEMDGKGHRYSWTYNAEMDPDKARQFVIYHEYGHVIHLTNTRNPQVSAQINEFLRDERPRLSGWDLLISKYGGSSDTEYVAEAFAVYMGGKDEHYRIHPKLLSIFRSIDREAR